MNLHSNPLYRPIPVKAVIPESLATRSQRIDPWIPADPGRDELRVRCGIRAQGGCAPAGAADVPLRNRKQLRMVA